MVLIEVILFFPLFMGWSDSYIPMFVDNSFNSFNKIIDKFPTVRDRVTDRVTDEITDSPQTLFSNDNNNPSLSVSRPWNFNTDIANGFAEALPAIPIVPGLKDRQKKCFDDIGCFSSHDDFNILQRPVSFLPMSPQELDVKFHLFTCNNKYRSIKFNYKPNDDEITQSPYDGSKRTIMIVHGYRDAYDDMEWNGDIKDLILQKQCDKYNVIGVDWSKGSKVLNYLTAVANTRVVGALIAHFITRMLNVTNTRVEYFHLIGHSLGAHICGYAGARFKSPKIGRITGLDPAGPAFQDKDPDTRLDPSDASLIDVFHTNMGNLILEGFGIDDPLGHYDFYPNGGNHQPGCELTRGVSNFLIKGTEGISDTISCNHGRAKIIPSIDFPLFSTCQTVGYKCDNYDEFVDGKCADCGTNNNDCSLMGSWTDYWENHSIPESKKSLFLKTSDIFPFYCLYHYQIVVHVSHVHNESFSSGEITISLEGERRDKDQIKLTKSWTKFKSGERYTYLLTYPKELGKVMIANVQWTFGGLHQINPINLIKPPSIKISHLQVNYMSNINKE